jgi:LPXTG-motif cell wall-anchored protein
MNLAFLRRVVNAISMVLLLATLAGSGVAEANGAPIKIVLSYLPGYSNWGPIRASGIAELVMAEGELNLTVTGLPQLSGGEVYGVWLMNSKTKQVLDLGQFNTDEKGERAYYKVTPSPIESDQGYDLLIISGEMTKAVGPRPSERLSIGGFFPTDGHTQPLPAQLPKTGGDASSPADARLPQTSNGQTHLALTAFALLAVLVIIWFFLLARKRRT